MNYTEARDNLSRQLIAPNAHQELAYLAKVIMTQVDEIKHELKEIPVAELIIVLNSVALAITNPSPESALACWDAGQNMLTHKAPEARSLGQTLSLMAGTCCFIAGVTLLAVSGPAALPISSILFNVSSALLKASTVSAFKKIDDNSTNTDSQLPDEFKTLLHQFKDRAKTISATSTDEMEPSATLKH